MLTIGSYYSYSLQHYTCDNCKHGPKMPKDVCLTCTVYKPGYGYWLHYVNWELKEANMNKCDKCKYFRDVFGNFVQCVKTGRFVDYEYWHNQEPEDCPTKDKPPKEE